MVKEFLERGFEVDHSTLNRWILAYVPLIEKRLHRFRKPHCGLVRIDGAGTFSPAIGDAVDGGLLALDPVHYVTKHLQQDIERDRFREKKNMPKFGGFRSFNSAKIIHRPL